MWKVTRILIEYSSVSVNSENISKFRFFYWVFWCYQSIINTLMMVYYNFFKIYLEDTLQRIQNQNLVPYRWFHDGWKKDQENNFPTKTKTKTFVSSTSTYQIIFLHFTVISNPIFVILGQGQKLCFMWLLYHYWMPFYVSESLRVTWLQWPTQ